MARTSRAAKEVMISFGQDDLGVLEALDKAQKKTRINRSELVRLCIRAEILEDEEAKATLRAFRHFSAAVPPTARDFPGAFA